MSMNRVKQDWCSFMDMSSREKITQNDEYFHSSDIRHHQIKVRTYSRTCGRNAKGLDLDFQTKALGNPVRCFIFITFFLIKNVSKNNIQEDTDGGTKNIGIVQILTTQ